MKQWWTSLSQREKQTVSAGGAVVCVYLIYALIFSPLSNKVDDLRQQIQHNQRLLTWMQQSDEQIRALEKAQHAQTAHTSASLLSLVQSDINNSPIAKSVTQLQQADNNAIQLKLDKVSFDHLMKWIIQLCQQQSLTVTDLAVKPDAEPGIVNAELKLS